MPVVPTEQNKVGIAGVTGEKLAAGDFAGSGLQAIGAGLGQLGGAMHELAGAQEAVDDAAVKRAYNAYAAGVRPALYEGAMVDQQGDAALQSVPTAIQQVFDQRDKAAAGLHERLRGQFLQAVAPRIEQDLQWIRDNHATQAKVAQRQQSDGVMANSARDAVSQYGTPGFEDSIATGLKQIDEQAAAGGWTSTAKAAAELGYVSGIHRDVVETLATQDPVLGGGYLRQRSAELTPADRAQAWQALQGPLTQAQAVADLDTLDLQRSPTAPQTPPGDLGLLARRMLAITPPDTGSGTAGTELPALLQRYRGDAAGAWAASRLGADAVDALIARHGDRWFGALPEETRRAVVGDMALLRSATSPRQAPAAADRAALAGTIEDQPWSDVRKRNVYDELNTRIALEDRRRSAAQDAAAAAGFELSDQLKERFLSINQLPPAVRRDLGADALAALTLRAERNLHPVTVAPHGDAMEKLNGMAATDPAGFAKLDLRLYRDQVTPAEYETLGRVQQAWSGYPPAAHGVTQQRSWERVKASGLETGSDATAIANQSNAVQDSATPATTPMQSTPIEEEDDHLANAETIPVAQRGAAVTKATMREMLRRGWTPDQIQNQNQLYDSYVARSLGQDLGSQGQSIDPDVRSGQPEHIASEMQIGEDAHLIPAGYSKAKSPATKARVPTVAEALPEWAKRRNASRWRSPIYLSDSGGKDIIDGLRRMGNPDGWTIVYSHGVPQSGHITDESRGERAVTLKAKDIFQDLGHHEDAKGTTILLTSCFAANGAEAKILSGLTHGTVYAAKAYVSAPSASNKFYELSVYTKGVLQGEVTGYAKFVDGREVPSDLLALRYDETTHRWTKVKLRDGPAPVGDRIPPPSTFHFFPW